MYAREHCHPTLSKIDDNKISKLYADLRRESMVTGGIPIAVRHIESMIRMSEAHAKMHLRQVVTDEDVNVAIGVMLESFIGSQKFSVMRPLRNYFQQYLVEAKDKFELLYFTLHQLITTALDLKRLVNETRPESQRVKIDKIEIKEEEFKSKAAALKVHNLEEFYKSKLFAENGLLINRQRKTIIKTL
jgi:DNA replication licensing factor MCM2